MPSRLRYKHRAGGQKKNRKGDRVDRIQADVDKNRGRPGSAPRQVDFVIVFSMRGDVRACRSSGSTKMEMAGSRARVVGGFLKMNMVKRRLQETPQEGSKTQKCPESPQRTIIHY